MLVLHQLVPHVHHVHEKLEAATQSVHDHLENDHHHSHDGADDKSDFLGFLLGNHAHNYHSDFNLRTEKKDLNRHIKEKDFPVYQVPALSIRLSKALTPLLGKHPPNPNYKVYLLNQALRGPPSLG